MSVSIASRPPRTFPPESEEIIPTHSMWQRSWISRLPQWLGKEDGSIGMEEDLQIPGEEHPKSRKVVAGIPRAPTFQRLNSEKREKLSPHQPCTDERRAASADRRRALSLLGSSALQQVTSAPSAASIFPDTDNNNNINELEDVPTSTFKNEFGETQDAFDEPPLPPNFPSADASEIGPGSDVDADAYDAEAEDMLQHELDTKWILNLSMHFRDKSDREKFFITYAETPNRWRRVTVSCDYRKAPPDSLERDLQELQYQRDKSARIYESIRDSLAEIQFYDTVTNLKLETSNDRLHVHVTEDMNEIIPYPPIISVQYLGCEVIPEKDLEFVSHLSGFVYKVKVRDEIFIKKEIPGPDTVDEFLYEINALHDLSEASNVIQFQGVVVDDRYEVVKGLLLSFAEQGALVDLLYDFKGQLEWSRREKWAKQIVNGLSEIHEAGFVQGDFTLSNIVVDDHDNAKIIDINRRGCPVGWEPPEIRKKIEGGQRISMYIGVKSDLYQLGMTLWALAQEEDEPERQPRPLTLDQAKPEIKDYYREIVNICLSDRPQDRKSAAQLLKMFPTIDSEAARVCPSPGSDYRLGVSLPCRPKEQLTDVSESVAHDDVYRFRTTQPSQPSPENLSSTGRTFVNPPGSADLQYVNSGAYRLDRRGRSPPPEMTELELERVRPSSATGSQEPGTKEEGRYSTIAPDATQKWDNIQLGGAHYLMEKGSFDENDLKILKGCHNSTSSHGPPVVTETLDKIPEDIDEGSIQSSGPVPNAARDYLTRLDEEPALLNYITLEAMPNPSNIPTTTDPKETLQRTASGTHLERFLSHLADPPALEPRPGSADPTTKATPITKSINTTSFPGFSCKPLAESPWRFCVRPRIAPPPFDPFHMEPTRFWPTPTFSLGMPFEPSNTHPCDHPNVSPIGHLSDPSKSFVQHADTVPETKNIEQKNHISESSDEKFSESNEAIPKSIQPDLLSEFRAGAITSPLVGPTNASNPAQDSTDLLTFTEEQPEVKLNVSHKPGSIDSPAQKSRRVPVDDYLCRIREQETQHFVPSADPPAECLVNHVSDPLPSFKIASRSAAADDCGVPTESSDLLPNFEVQQSEEGRNIEISEHPTKALTGPPTKHALQYTRVQESVMDSIPKFIPETNIPPLQPERPSNSPSPSLKSLVQSESKPSGRASKFIEQLFLPNFGLEISQTQSQSLHDSNDASQSPPKRHSMSMDEGLRVNVLANHLCHGQTLIHSPINSLEQPCGSQIQCRDTHSDFQISLPKFETSRPPSSHGHENSPKPLSAYLDNNQHPTYPSSISALDLNAPGPIPETSRNWPQIDHNIYRLQPNSYPRLDFSGLGLRSFSDEPPRSLQTTGHYEKKSHFSHMTGILAGVGDGFTTDLDMNIDDDLEGYRTPMSEMEPSNTRESNEQKGSNCDKGEPSGLV
ncbi:MAG: hypothetical protein M1834_003992 [Cirrosporium novae-zelandiae]|nr:MAG: hypothetical protein M1834_003992 [Cirrosporium novae-zelandiae]